MKSIMKKRYSAAFRAQAVELVRLGKPVAVVGEDLCIGTSVLYRWLGEGPHSNVVRTEGAPGSGDLPPDVELRQLRRENANLKLENDILKKAAVILGTKPQWLSAR
jgi:transposase